MFRKLILVSTLLVLAVTQALAVNCDLSCVLTGGLWGHGACAVHAAGAGEDRGHCHPVPARSADDRVAALTGHSCGSAFCKTGLLAVTGSSATKGSPSRAESVNLSAAFGGLVPAGDSLYSAPRHHFFRYPAGSPLVVRSGTSLRI